MIPSRHSVLALVAFALLLAGSPSRTVAASSRPGTPSVRGTAGPISPEAAGSYHLGEILIRFDPASSATARAQCLQDHGLELVEDCRIIKIQRHKLPAGVSVAEALRKLRRDSRVALVQPNYVYAADACPQDPALKETGNPNQWGVFKTYLLSLWKGHNGGMGKTIAILDTGAQLTHPDLAGGAWTNPGEIPGNSMDDDGNGFTDDVNGWDFVGSDGDPADDNGHGTHVTGIACARANLVGLAGTAYNATFMTIKILNSSGGGSSVTVASGLEYAARMQPDVVNMSFSVAPTPLDPDADCIVREACASAYARGCVLVASSGNSGDGGPVSFPASFDGIISVGALSQNETVWPMSNYGDDLDVVAPGDSVWSTLPGGTYGWKKGTSMASPFVSGVCALLLARFPELTAWEMEVFLRKQARDVDGLSPGGPANKDGYGLVSFGTVKDYGNWTLPVAWSQNAFWEWLGADVSGESARRDTVAVGANDGDDDMPDLDGVSNETGSGEDGYDDGVFPLSHTKLPIMPNHLAGGPQQLNVRLGVCNHSGVRYAAGESLQVRAWADSNANGTFENPSEQLFTGSSAPGGWPSDSKDLSLNIAAKEYHWRGNPLRVRTRLYGPNEAPGLPTGSQNFGEVEDQLVLNFVEDFDTTYHSNVYADLNSGFPGGWSVWPDAPFIYPDDHHGTWHYAYAQDTPNLGVDVMMVLPEMAAPALDLRELTTCRVKFWALHAIIPCATGGGTDNCRVTVRRYNASGVDTGEFLLQQLPQPIDDVCGGPGPSIANYDLDLSPYLGGYVRIVVHHTVSNMLDHLAIDDVVVYGYDGQDPGTVVFGTQTLSANRVASVGWTHPNDNQPAGLSDGTCVLYGARIWSGTDTWASGFRLTPRDFVNGASSFPIPAAAGGSVTRGLLAPSVFPVYKVAVRAQDEVSREGPVPTLATLSVTPSFSVVASAPTPIDTVAAGDSLKVAFVTTSMGNALDAVACKVTDTQNWILCSKKWTHVLDPFEGAVESVMVHVPISAIAGTRDTLVLADTSLSSAAANDTARVILLVGGTPVCNHIADHDTGSVRFSVTDEGIHGFLSSDQLQGSGFVYPKTGGWNELFIGGFWASTDTGHVYNRDYLNDEADWVPSACLQFSGGSSLAVLPGHEEGLGVFSDGGHASPQGLSVTQRSYTWGSAPDDDYVILVYVATNEGSSTISNLWLAQFADWDVGGQPGFQSNLGGVDPAHDLIYMYRPGPGAATDSVHVGVRALSPHDPPQISFISNPSYVYALGLIDDVDRFHFVRGDLPAYSVQQTDSVTDWSVVVSAGPYTLAPGDTVRVAYAMVGGVGLNNLLANGLAAQRTWAANWVDDRTAVGPAPEDLPNRLDLSEASPNPFSNETVLRFGLPRADRVVLEIYDVSGRLVSRLADGRFEAGRHQVRWSGLGESGRAAASGIYLARLQALGESRTRKLLLSR